MYFNLVIIFIGIFLIILKIRQSRNSKKGIKNDSLSKATDTIAIFFGIGFFIFAVVAFIIIMSVGWGSN